LGVGINIKRQLLAAFLLLVRFCQKEKLQIQNSKKKKKIANFQSREVRKKRIKIAIFIYLIFSL
jgi:hypothetical protein